MTYERNDGSAEEPIWVRMIEVAPHVYVNEPALRAIGERQITPVNRAADREGR